MDRIKRLNEKISDADSYETIKIDKYISINSRLHFFKAIKHLKNDSLPYLNTGFPFIISKFLHKDPHSAVNFVWKQPRIKEDQIKPKFPYFQI